MDLIVGYAAILMDICRTNRDKPNLLAYEMLTLVSADITQQTDRLLQDHDDARFQAMWGHRGTVGCAWDKIVDSAFDEGFDDLNPAEDAAFDAIEAAHPTTFNPKGL
jgi:hypothetical protein